MSMYMPETGYNPGFGMGRAFALIRGGLIYPNIRGVAWFFDTPAGVQVFVQVSGLPPYQPATATRPQIGPHGFHIHQFANCQPGTVENPFPGTGEHYNPTNQPHGNHAGDFPVLFSNNGFAQMGFFTNKFRVRDILNRSLVIHESPDDYRTQPAGNSGRKIACGEIRQF